MSISRITSNHRVLQQRIQHERVTRFTPQSERASLKNKTILKVLGAAALAFMPSCAAPQVLTNTPLLSKIAERHEDLQAGKSEKIARENAMDNPPWLQLRDSKADPALAKQFIERDNWHTLWNNSPKLSFQYHNEETGECVRINYVRFGNQKAPVKIYSVIGTPDCVLSQIPYMMEVAKSGKADIVIAEVTGGQSDRDISKLMPTVDRQAQANLSLIQSLGFCEKPSEQVLILSGFSNGPFKLGPVIASGKVPFDGFMMLAPWFPEMMPDATQSTSDEWMIVHTPLLVKLFGKAPVLGVQAAVKGLVESNDKNADQVDEFCSQWSRTFGDGWFVDSDVLQEMRHEITYIDWIYDHINAFTSLMREPVGRALRGKPVMIVNPTHDSVIRTDNDTHETMVELHTDWNGMKMPSGQKIKVEGTDEHGETHAMRLFRVLKNEFGADVEIHFVNSNHLMFEAAPDVAKKILEFIEKTKRIHEEKYGPLPPVSILWKQPAPKDANFFPALQLLA